MAKKLPTEPATPPKLTASQRQTAYVQRKKEKGLVQLSGLFVPKELRDEVRKLVSDYVANWQEAQEPQDEF